MVARHQFLYFIFATHFKRVNFFVYAQYSVCVCVCVSDRPLLGSSTSCKLETGIIRSSVNWGVFLKENCQKMISRGITDKKLPMLLLLEKLELFVFTFEMQLFGIILKVFSKIWFSKEFLHINAFQSDIFIFK